MPDEALVRPEGQRAGARVQPVGAGHQVEAARPAAVEGDPHVVGGLLQGGDRVAENILDLPAGGLVQQAGQVVPEDLQIARADRHGQRGVLVGQRRITQTQVQRFGLLQQGHPVQHVQRLAAQARRVPARAHPRGALHHGRGEPVVAQPVRQGGPGDAGTANKDVHPRAPSISG